MARSLPRRGLGGVHDRLERAKGRAEASGCCIPGEKQLLIPVDTIRKREWDHVYVDQDHERVAAGPEQYPALVSDPGYQAGVYDWYGFAPYWHPSFVSPAGWSQR